MKNKKILETREQKLLGILEDMNGNREVHSDKLICETLVNMARIRAYSDFMYLLRQRPIQTACYYGAGFFLLTTIAAIWTKEWLLTAVFGVIFGVLATLPHNMRIRWFNRSADALEKSYGKNLNVEFADDKLIIREAPVPVYKERTLDDDNGENNESNENPENTDSKSSDGALPVSEVRSDEAPRELALIAEYPYSTLTAVECSHSFYIFPQKSEAILCDKTLFVRGTPMAARDFLARKLGKKFRIKIKAK